MPKGAAFCYICREKLRLTAARKADQIRKLYRASVSKAEIARRLQIGRTSVRRILKAGKAS